MTETLLIAEASGRFQIWWNDAYGSVLIQFEGILIDADAEVFYRNLAGPVERSRARHGHALLLLDFSSNALMGDAVLKGFKRGDHRSARGDDRIALVLCSSLMKLRMREVPASEVQPEYFISRGAAETWLHAHVRVLTH